MTMIKDAQEIARKLVQAVERYVKADEEMKTTTYFVEWDKKHKELVKSVSEMDKLIDALIPKYNAMARHCGVTNRKDIVRSIVSGYEGIGKRGVV